MLMGTLLAAVLLAQPAPGNLVKNGSFEVDENSDGLPDGWTFAWKQTHASDQPGTKREPDWGVSTQAHSGNRCVFVANARPQDDGVWSQDAIPAKPGCRVYRITAWIRVAACQNSDARVALVWLDRSRRWLGANYSVIRVSKPCPWTRFVGLCQVDPRAAFLRIRLWVNFEYSGTCEAYFDDITLEPTNLPGLPPLRHTEGRPDPAVPSRFRRLGFVPFARSFMDMLLPTSRPEASDIGATLRAAAATGETEILSVGIWALRDISSCMPSASSLRGPAGSAIPSDAISIHPIAYLVRVIHFTDRRQMLVPVYLKPNAAFAIPSGQCRWVWLIVRVPARIRPGPYTGSLTIACDGESVEVPIRLDVYSVRLPQPDGIYFGMYDSPFGYYESTEGLLEKFRDQRAHGMTTVGLFCNFGGRLSADGGRVEVDVAGSLLAKAVDAYKAAGFRMPLHWLMGQDIHRFALKAGPAGSDAYLRRYATVIRQIVDYGRRHGWPEIIYQPVDEPFEFRARWDAMMAGLRALKMAGVRTEEDGMNSRPEGLDQAWPLLDVLNLHYGPFPHRNSRGEDWPDFLRKARRDGKMIWFYNLDVTGFHPEAVRFGYGFHLYKAGADGMFTWQYQGRYKNPYAQPPSRWLCLHRYPAMAGHPGGPTTGWEAIRQGVEDYRLLLAFRSLAASARRAGGARARIARQAAQRLEDALNRIDYSRWKWRSMQGEWTGGETTDENGYPTVVGHFKLPNGWSFDDYDNLRRVLLRACQEMAGLQCPPGLAPQADPR